MIDLTYKDALAKAHHLIALGHTTIWLHGDTDFPWDKVIAVETGSSYRLSGPSGCYVIAEDAGLKFRLSVDFETSNANGKGVSLFDRAKLRDVIGRLPAAARKQFADMLSDQVLPGLEKRSREIREALNAQTDSEDCVRGLISFAERPS